MAKASLKEEGGYRLHLQIGECQLVVFGINTTPQRQQESPIWSTVKTAQSVSQLNYEAAWL